MSMLYKIQRLSTHITDLISTKLKDNRVNVIWWAGEKNFGDLVTKELLGCYGKTAINTPGEKADFAGVGSILHILPKTFSGKVLGSGCIKDERLNLPNADFCFVRGELTKKSLGLDPKTPIGDLGLLAGRLLAQSSNIINKKFKFGLIPHYVDTNHPWINSFKEKLGKECLIINVKDDAKNVARKIKQCDVILSSSLHGIIFADAFEIPNVWLRFSDKVVGGSYKFNDYNSSIDFEQRFLNVTDIVDIKTIEKNICFKSKIAISTRKKILEGIMDNFFLVRQ